MKKFRTLIATFCLTLTYAHAQNTYLWPIAGVQPGIGIVCKPQGYINNELNFADLFITAPEGTTVVAPADGIITTISTYYPTSLYNSWSSSVETTFDAAIAKIRKDLDKKYDPQYVSGSLSIRCTNGNVIHISGLSGNQIFKTGQKITRGTPIGQVAYSYRQVKEPSIRIAIDRNGQVSDPMTPFGLKTTFIAPAAVKPISFLTKQQVKEDFLLYIDILKECYPGLYDVITPEELDNYVKQTKTLIDAHPDNWPFVNVMVLFNKIMAKIHDSHIYMYYPQWYIKQSKYTTIPQLTLGWFGDTLMCWNASGAYKHLLNRPVKTLNGVPAEQLKQELISKISTYDGGVESWKNVLITWNTTSLFRIPGTTNYDSNMRLEMADTKEVIAVSGLKPGTKVSFLYSTTKFMSINKHGEGYKTEMLNDSTAYIGFSTFGLNQVQVEKIAHFIASIAKVPNLIIDVRNNGGGDAKVLSKLYSYIAGKPMTLHGYTRVNKQGGYKSFAYSLNRVVEDSLFADYKPEAGKEGFYSGAEAENEIKADPIVNYKGKVYVLTNESSISAATMFPALLVRNHRGVIVGRETRTAYHYMNALKFASIRLPHSTLTINVPLVHCRFDTAENKRVPYGRGVLPDYEVPITVDEILFKNGDAILNCALQLIKEGKYLKGENPFTD